MHQTIQRLNFLSSPNFAWLSTPHGAMLPSDKYLNLAHINDLNYFRFNPHCNQIKWIKLQFLASRVNPKYLGFYCCLINAIYFLHFSTSWFEIHCPPLATCLSCIFYDFSYLHLFMNLSWHY